MANGLRQHLLADAGHLVRQAAEAQRSLFRQDFQHQHRPLVGDTADQVEDQGSQSRIDRALGGLRTVRAGARDLRLGDLKVMSRLAPALMFRQMTRMMKRGKA